MVFTNAINNQIPNSVLRGQGYDSFNISPARKREIATEEEFAPIAALTSGFLAGNTLVAPLLDIALTNAQGLGKGLSVIPGLGPEFAKGVERTIPEPFVQKALENALLFGQREDIARTAGELPFMLGELGGAITSGAGLAKTVPQVGGLFGTAFDIASGTPGATGFLEGATTAGQAIGRGAAIGAAGSVLPAIDVAYNAQQGIIDPMAGLGTLGFGAALGGAIPAVPIGAAKGKQFLDDIAQTVRKRIINSDTVKTEQQLAQQQFEAQQAQQMAVQKQMEQMPFENPLAPKIEEQAPEVALPQEDIPFESTLDENESITLTIYKNTERNYNELEAQQKQYVQQQKELQNQIAEIKKTQTQEPEVLNIKKVPERDLFEQGDVVENEIARWFGDKPRGRINKESVEKIIGKIDDRNLSATYFKRKENFKQLEKSKKNKEPNIGNLYEGVGVDEAAQEIKAILESRGNGVFDEADIAERIASFMTDNPSAVPGYKKKLFERYSEFRKGENEQFAARADNDITLLENQANELQRIIDTQNEQLQNRDVSLDEILNDAPRLREYLRPQAVEPKPQTIQQEAQTEGPELKIAKGPEGQMKLKSTAEAETPGASVEEKIRYSAKNSVNRISPITNMISRLSKKVGAAFNDFAVRPGIYKNEFLNQLKPLVDVVKKYAKDPTVMKNLGNVNRVGYEALPQDLAQVLEAAQPIFRNEAEALNKKGMDISLTDEIYFPRGWNNIDELQTRLGTITQRESEFRNAPIAMKNRMLSRELEKSKTIPEVTDDIVDLFDPMQGIANWIENTAEKKAEVDLFGNATGKYEENISNLLLKYKDDFKSPQDIQKTMDIMIKAFESQNISSSSAFKLYSGLGSAAIFTGDTTALSQFNDVFLSMARNGLLNSFSGIAQTITSLFPGYKGPMKDILKRTGMSESVAAYTDIGQLDKFADFFGLLKKKQFAEAIGAAAGNAGLALNKVNFWRTRITDAIGKKGNLIGRHERLKNNPNLIWDDIGEFQPDPQKQQEIFNYYKDLKDNYKIAKYKSMPSDVVAYLLNSGLKYHVKTQFDRNIGSITGNDIERMANFTMSFGNKFAATLKDDFVKLSKEVITSKNPAKTAKKLLEAAAGASIVIGGGITLALMKGGYNIGFGEEGLPTTPEAIQKAGVEFIAGSTAPMETRLVKSYQGIKEANAPDSKTAAVVNSLFPGLPTASKAYTDAIQTFSEGGLADVYNPNLNPSFRYMPPRIVTDYLYSQSDEFKRNMAKKSTQLQVQPYQEQKTIDDLNARANDVLQYKSVLDPENVKLVETREVGSNAYRTGLKRLEEEKRNLGTYGTNDPQMVANAQTKKLLVDAQITREEARLRELAQQGAITQDQFVRAMKYNRNRKRQLGIR